MKPFSQFLDNHSTGRKVLGLFILCNMVYAMMLLVTIPRTMSYSAGMKLLDMMPSGYDMEYIIALFNTLGEEGRGLYLYQQIPVDMIYPVLFGLSYALLMAYFLKKLGKLRPPFTFLCLIPMLAGIADYLENLGIIAMLRSYPEISPFIANMTNSFSLIKSISTTCFFIILIIVLIALGIKALTKKTVK